MKIERDKVIFSSGVIKYANNGIIGLSPELSVSEGYDGGFCDLDAREFWEDMYEEPLTDEDLIELGNFMIEQWKKFIIKATAKNNQPQTLDLSE